LAFGLAEAFVRSAAGSAFTGGISLPHERDFIDRIAIDNGRIDRRPALLLYPREASDVVAAIRFARDSGSGFRIKGGGHGAAGYCLVEDGVVLDMREMRTLHPSGDGAVAVGAGARWMEVYRALEAQPLYGFAVGGACGDIGVVGFLLGGGYSFLSRSCGLGADRLRELEIVLADGRVVTASEREHPDLFWACRGGGGGNFGVVTRAVIEVARLGHPELAFVEVDFDGERIPDLLASYHRWSGTLPDTIAAYGRWIPHSGVAAEAGSSQRVQLTCVGDCSPAELLRLVEPLRDMGGLPGDVTAMTMAAFQRRFGGRTALAGANAYIRSGIVRSGKDWPLIGVIILQHLATAPTPETFLVWTHAGGRIDEPAPEDTAFVHRGAPYVLEIKAIWRDPAMSSRSMRWAYDFFEALRPFFVGAYVNYIDPYLEQWQDAYYGGNYPRLVSVKATYDPDRVFDFPQAIGSREPTPQLQS
jgi:hypothetical protein